ncbi:hypothetical protein [Streptomyces laurentii]|uniref:hypothetical protein n=1 Tax=Streptomyces laurentii TaxID=39478 RepID=UPI003402D769
MSRDRRCPTCRITASATASGPTAIVADVNGQDVYACATHRADHAGPADDPLVPLAQLQDMARHRPVRQ